MNGDPELREARFLSGGTHVHQGFSTLGDGAVEVLLLMPLAPPTFRQLAHWRRLSLNTSRSFPGGSGRRLGPRTGASVEFADFRPYTPGDDLRRVDWSLYARSGRLFVRTFLEEQHVKLGLLVDASASMGDPHAGKFATAVGLATAMACAGLCGGHVVRVAFLRDGECEASPPAGREAAFPGLLDFLGRRAPGGATRLIASLERFLSLDSGRSFVVLLSDLLDPGAAHDVPATLVERGHQVHVLHLVADGELGAGEAGPTVIVDRETGETREVIVDAATADEYARAMGERLEGWRRAAVRHGFYYRVVPADAPLEESVQRLVGPAEMLVARG